MTRSKPREREVLPSRFPCDPLNMDQTYQIVEHGIAGYPLTNSNTIPRLHGEGYPLQDFRSVDGVPCRQVVDNQFPVRRPSTVGFRDCGRLRLIFLLDDQVLLDTLKTVP